MLDFGYQFFVILFVIILFLIMCGIEKLFKKIPKKQKNAEYFMENHNCMEVSSEEFFKVLNFMFLYGIINLEEYNELEKKALSYVG